MDAAANSTCFLFLAFVGVSVRCPRCAASAVFSCIPQNRIGSVPEKLHHDFRARVRNELFFVVFVFSCSSRVCPQLLSILFAIVCQSVRPSGPFLDQVSFISNILLSPALQTPLSLMKVMTQLDCQMATCRHWSGSLWGSL